MLYDYAKFGHPPVVLLPSCDKIKSISLDEVDQCYSRLDADIQTDYLVTVIRCAGLVGGKKGGALAERAVQLAFETAYRKNESAFSSLVHCLGMYASNKEHELLANAVKKINMMQQRILHPAPDHLA